MKLCYNKTALLESGLATNFLLENSNPKGARLRLLTKKQTKIDSDKLDEGILGLNGTLKEWKFTNPTQHKNVLFNYILIETLFRANGRFEVGRSIFTRDYIRYLFKSLNNINSLKL